MKKLVLTCIALMGACTGAQTTIKNDIYTVTCNADFTISVQVSGAPAQTLTPEFAVMFSDRDPVLDENHSNYLLAPRIAMLWRDYEESEGSLNARLNTPASLKDLRYIPNVRGSGENRVWTWYADETRKKTRLRVTGRWAQGTIDPFQAGDRYTLRAAGMKISGNVIQWTFSEKRGQPFDFTAALELPKGAGDPRIMLQFRARRNGYFSAAFTGAPSLSLKHATRIDQDTCSNFRIFNYVVGEGSLHMPLVCLGSDEGWASGLALGAANMPFVTPGTDTPRIPYRNDARCGAMLRKDYETDSLQPLLFAPLMGGADSQMRSGDMRLTTVHYMLRAGDWKNVYAEAALKYYHNIDLRDNTGTGSLNRTLERIADFLTDRNGQNYAMWHDEQKYYDYANDLPSSFKPFSPLFGLSMAIVFDNERFYRTRVRPQVEFALSRNANYFTPYAFEKDSPMISKINRNLGAPYLSYVQLVTLDGVYQNRNYALQTLAGVKGASRSSFPEMLAKYSVTSDPADLATALADAKADLASSPDGARNHFMDWLDAWEASGDTAATRNTAFLKAAEERIYNKVISTITLAPTVPNINVTMDPGGFGPIHVHTVGRHKKWGFPEPLGYPTPQQTVPAWRGALNGLQGLGSYRGEFWMDNHGHFMRIGALTSDNFLSSLARWGMVGRFAHYPGDNRSAPSLLVERPELAENPLWKMTHATYNPGHAWEFSAAVFDFLVSDIFKHSDGAIDFPSRSMSGAQFRVRLYGDRPGTFYDDTGVMLWMPKNLATASSPHIDYISGYGNGKLYFAFVNQSATAQDVEVEINPELADLSATRETPLWINNKRQPASVPVANNRIRFKISGRGIVACAIPGAKIHRELHAKVFAPEATALGPGSLQRTPLAAGAAPTVTVTGMLLTLGKGLTHAYVYSGAQASDTQTSKIRFRQGENAAWQEKADAIFPYEYSVDLTDGAGDFEYYYSITTANGETYTTPLVRLSPGKPDKPASAITATPPPEKINATKDTAPQPPAPTGLKAIAQNDGSIQLTWNKIPGAISYLIKRTDVAAGPYFGPYRTVAKNINGTSYTDAGGFHMNITQHYVVSAMTDTGESADSVEATAIPYKGRAPKQSRPASASNNRWKSTQRFISYMKEVTNSSKTSDFGKSATNERYYPYTTPYGRLIGYGSPAQNNADYTDGITESEATARLVKRLDAVATALSADIPQRYPGKRFEQLSTDLQEVLVDHGYTEGVENIPATLIDVVFGPDPWERMANDMVYVRVYKGLIQFPKNKAFFTRWLDPKNS